MQLRLPDPALTLTGASLRRWQSSDASALLEAWGDPEIARWNPVPNAPTLAQASAWLARYDQRLARGSALDLVLVETDSGDVVGEVGIAGIDHERRAAHIGYWLLPAARRRGLAAQAVDVFSEWLIADMAMTLLVARCAVANRASQQVARAAGYRHARNDDHGHQLWLRRATSSPQ